jgi:hypothetical protein
LGGNNELFSDNLRALEDLYDLHDSFKNTTTEKKASAADARARDRAKGDAIRDASLGLFVSSRDGGTSDEEEQQDKENNNPETPAAVASKKKQSSCQFWFFWTIQRWRSGLSDDAVCF